MPQTTLAAAKSVPPKTLDVIDWDTLDAGKYRDEREVVADLLASKPLSLEDRSAVRAEAQTLVRNARKSATRQGVVEGLSAGVFARHPRGAGAHVPRRSPAAHPG